VFVIDIPGSGHLIDSHSSEGTDQKFITIRRGKAGDGRTKTDLT
jgi:hypothetical protein